MKKKYNLILILSSFLIFAAMVFLLGPINSYVKNDAVYRETFLPILLDILLDIFQIAAFIVAYSVIFYSSYKFKSKGTTVAQVLIFLGALLFFYAGNVLMDLDAFFDPVMLIYVGESLGLELILHGAILGYGLWSIADCEERLLPFEGLVSLSNPMQRSVFVSALMLSLSKVLSRISYDINYGAPKNDGEILEMVLYYSYDVLIGVIALLVMTYLLLSFYSSDTKKEKANA